MKWPDIEDAPKDGTLVLVWHNEITAPTVAYWGVYHPNSKGKACWRSADGNKLETPILWHEIPGINQKHWTAL